MMAAIGILLTIFGAVYYIGIALAFFLEGDIFETRVELLLSLLPFGYIVSRVYREYKELPWNREE